MKQTSCCDCKMVVSFLRFFVVIAKCFDFFPHCINLYRRSRGKYRPSDSVEQFQHAKDLIQSVIGCDCSLLFSTESNLPTSATCLPEQSPFGVKHYFSCSKSHNVRTAIRHEPECRILKTGIPQTGTIKTFFEKV